MHERIPVDINSRRRLIEVGLCTGVDLSKILGRQTKLLGAEGGKK